MADVLATFAADPGFWLVIAAILAVVAVVFLATRRLSRAGRWLARGTVTAMALIAVGLAVLVPPASLVDFKSGLGGERASESEAIEQQRAEQEAVEQRRSAREALESRRRVEASRILSAQREAEAPQAAAPPVGAPPSDPSAAPRTRSATRAPASVEPWDVVPIFYGTDRARDSVADQDPAKVVYSDGRARRLELGRALVTIPKTHEVPRIERPWVYKLPFTQIVLYEEPEDPAKHFTLREIRALDEAQFLEFVRQRLGQSKDFKDHALVFIHGFNTRFDFAMYRAAQIAYDLKFDGAPFAYTWPSRGGVLNYGFDRESAEQARPFLREFLTLVAEKSGAKQISIVAHSMGNYVLLPVLEELRRSLPPELKLSQVILAAPDVSRDDFQGLAQAVIGVSRGITLYASGNDQALKISRNVWGTPRAGDVPPGGPIIVEGVDTVDVSALRTDVFDLNHSGYAQNTELLRDIETLIRTGMRPPELRLPGSVRPIATPAGVYWRYGP